MAYKFLKNVLPVDIVNKVLEYKEYNTQKFHMNKIFNIIKMKLICLKTNKKEIYEIKKYNYIEVIVSYSTTDISLDDIKISFTEETDSRIYNYIKNKCKKCYFCELNKVKYNIVTVNYCELCDYTICRNDEFIDYILDGK